MSEFLPVCEQAARAGGAILQQWVGKFKVREKAPADLVTEADLASQEAIREILAKEFPDHGFVGEEDGDATRPDVEFNWIVDPLDGTSNYAHGVPHYSVSVALERRGELIAGTVFDPVLDECFTASQGDGANVNGVPIHVSGQKKLSGALLAASFPAKVTADLVTIREFISLLPQCQGIRRAGSAALNLAYLAAGRYDAYWARDLWPWDAAAGALLVMEAGGLITSPDGGRFDVWNPKLIAAASEPLYQEFDAQLRRSG